MACNLQIRCAATLFKNSCFVVATPAETDEFPSRLVFLLHLIKYEDIITHRFSEKIKHIKNTENTIAL